MTSTRVPSPWGRLHKALLALASGAILSLPALAPATAQTRDQPVVTWAAPMVSSNPTANNRIANQTLRQIAHISLGGERLRVKFSNRWGTVPLEVGGAMVALRTTEADIDPASRRALSFGGVASFSVPAGGELLSDWVDLTVADQADLAIDLYLPGDTVANASALTVRNGALQTTYLSTEGNHVGATALPVASTRLQWNFLAAVDVAASTRLPALLAFGDSITEGLRATVNTNRRWPDVLAGRLLPTRRMGVANLGISGNRVWTGGGATNPSAMARFDPDVLAQSGATHVIIMLGINDISGGATADDVIAAHRQIITRARTQQLKILGGTLTPFGNAPDAREAHRLAVNQWIRTSREFDGVVDFDAALRDPANPRRMLPQYDSGDSLHPSDAGYEAMGNAVDLRLLR